MNIKISKKQELYDLICSFYILINEKRIKIINTLNLSKHKLVRFWMIDIKNDLIKKLCIVLCKVSLLQKNNSLNKKEIKKDINNIFYIHSINLISLNKLKFISIEEYNNNFKGEILNFFLNLEKFAKNKVFVQVKQFLNKETYHEENFLF